MARLLLNPSRTIAHLLPMFLQMLKDDFPDVRLHIISKLELVNKGERYVFAFSSIKLMVLQSLVSSFCHSRYYLQSSS